jgi:hypothetical protein
MCIGFFIDLNIYMNTNPPPLSITDLAVIKQTIDLAASRGAFRASEMKSVGEVYDKLTAFLQAVIQQAEAEQALANNKESTND